ncbi:hypothetical protein [Staphylococcus felis]|uniref:hypothetical protein n=1 Tax=Staphylococcus felis TaxID=46127 RepID=UPI000CD0B931|nr:hypothetical protein [Staphylococcus felis]AVP37426.1 hypothetical protein C7J90_10835 [Staphylococcus felis]PNZ37104.1 hypothetical protein CD143_02570 [Staphylococcus felis]QQB02627.1 hypothetical protein I6H71_07675 [Staphylococcus felis]
MAKIKVKTLAVIDSNPVGSVIELDEKDVERFSKIGYVKEVEGAKSAKDSTKKTQAKRRNTKTKEQSDN